MPRTARDILSFSDHWFRLVKEINDNQRVVKLPYANDAQYRSLMNEFYGFRKALRTTPEFGDVSRKAGQIRTYREAGMVVFHHVNTGRFAHMLLDALGPDVEPAFVPPTAEEAKVQETDFVDNESDTVILMSKYFKEA